MRFKLFTAAIIAGAAITGVVAAAPAQAAYPKGCSFHRSAPQSWSYCGGNADEAYFHTAWISCQRITNGAKYTNTGNEAAWGHNSWVDDCVPGDTELDHGIHLR